MEIQVLDLRDRGKKCLDHPLIRLVAILNQHNLERLRVLVDDVYTPLEGLTKVIPLLGYRIERVEKIGKSTLILDLSRVTDKPPACQTC